MKKIALILTIILGITSLCGCDVLKQIEETKDNLVNVEFSPGKISGNVYENSFLGIGIQLDEEWTFGSDEDIEKLNEQAEESLALDINNPEITYDMFASNEITHENISINFQSIEFVNSLINTEESYVNATIPQMEESLRQLGTSDIKVKVRNASIAGEEHAAIVSTHTYSGMDIYQISVCIEKGNYIATITVTSFDKESADKILNDFYPL